jgi:DNA-binding response OmpR family regulator
MARIIVVDDDFTLGTFICEYLNHEGHQATYCSSPQDAPAVIAAEKPDLAVLDYSMPAMTGTQLLSLLRAQKETKKLPILFLSGTDPLRFAFSVPSDPRMRFLRKPPDLEELRTMIAELLNPEGWSSAAP